MRTTVISEMKTRLDARLVELEIALDADVVSVLGPIMMSADRKVRDALDGLDPRRGRLAVILHTGGGLVEVAERMVTVIRHSYREVSFVVPDFAFSAGTVLAMSGDSIMMDFASCLGPVDPQIERNGRLVPALSYVALFDELMGKAREGKLNTAEFALLEKFDLAEIHQFREAKTLSESLIANWLSVYKFKDWTRTETRGQPVTTEMKLSRAQEVAGSLSNYTRWHAHGRGISMKTLQDEVRLRVDDFGKDRAVSRLIHGYFELASDFIQGNAIPHFVHSRGYI